MAKKFTVFRNKSGKVTGTISVSSGGKVSTSGRGGGGAVASSRGGEGSGQKVTVVVGPSSKGDAARGLKPGTFVGRRGQTIADVKARGRGRAGGAAITERQAQAQQITKATTPRGFDIREQMATGTFSGRQMAAGASMIQAERTAFALPSRKIELAGVGAIQQARIGRQERFEASPTGKTIAFWEKGEKFASEKVKKVVPGFSEKIKTGVEVLPINTITGPGKVGADLLIGGFEEARERPLTVLGTTALFGTFRLAGKGIGAGVRVISKTPVGKAAVSKAKIAFDIIKPSGLGVLGGIFAKDVKTRVSEVPGGISQKTRKFGGILSTEVIPAGAGFFLAGPRVAAIPGRVKAKVKKIQFERKIKKFETRITEKGKGFKIPKREVFAATGEVGVGFPDLGTGPGARVVTLETIKLKAPKGIAAEGIQFEAPLEQQFFLGKSRETQTQLRPKKFDPLPLEIQTAERRIAEPTIAAIRKRGEVKVTRTFKSEFDPIPQGAKRLMQRRSQPSAPKSFLQQRLVGDMKPKLIQFKPQPTLEVVDLVKGVKFKVTPEGKVLGRARLSPEPIFELPKARSIPRARSSGPATVSETILSEPKSFTRTKTFVEQKAPKVSDFVGEPRIRTGVKSRTKVSTILERGVKRRATSLLGLESLVKPRLDVAAVPRTRLVQSIKSVFAFDFIGKPITDTSQGQVAIPITDFGTGIPLIPIMGPPSFGGGRGPPPPPTPTTPRLPGGGVAPFFFGLGGAPSGKGSRGKGSRFKGRYTASLVAVVKEIKGRRPTRISGLEVRPLPL